MQEILWTAKVGSRTPLNPSIYNARESEVTWSSSKSSAKTQLCCSYPILTIAHRGMP